MNSTAPLLETLQDMEPARDDFLGSVVEGLNAPQKHLHCKFLYDEEGSHLFDDICELPEYYPTRTEIGILESHAPDIASVIGPQAQIVEFGSGAGIKIRLLLSALTDPVAYMPVEISREHLLAASANLASDFPALRIAPVCADYTQPFTLPDLEGETPANIAGFFPGSTIGNFTRDEAVKFLALTRRLLGRDATMIIGIDLVKDIDTLRAAYNDTKGVTAAFNLNFLKRINRELDADFDLAAFEHDARWNPELERIEMHLVSKTDQTVTIGENRFAFRKGETIHTESSHKYRIEGFRALAREAGYEPERVWTDERNYFSVHALRAV